MDGGGADAERFWSVIAIVYNGGAPVPSARPAGRGAIQSFQAGLRPRSAIRSASPGMRNAVSSPSAGTTATDA